MRIWHQVSFDGFERRRLACAALSVRIAFPTDRQDAAHAALDRATDRAQKASAAKALEQARRDWPGRYLNGIARKDRFTAVQVKGALDALDVLIDVLAEQSVREYWERELMPADRIHKAEPSDFAGVAESVCVHCHGEIKRVSGGRGPMWVHSDTGAVAAQGGERHGASRSVKIEAEAEPVAVGLVAPGTDVCGMLAEQRQAQLREAEEARPILAAAFAQLADDLIELEDDA